LPARFDSAPSRRRYRFVFVVETDFVFAAFLQIVVEEVIGHVKALWEGNGSHGLIHFWPGIALRPGEKGIYFCLVPASHSLTSGSVLRLLM
jgi:hypothetical protein